MDLPLKLSLNRLSIMMIAMCWMFTASAQEKKPFVLRTIDWGYRIVQGDSAHPYKKYIFAVPIIAYRPESKWIFGISLAHIFRSKNREANTRPSTIRVNISYSQMKQFSVKPFVEYFSNDNRLNIRFLGQYTNFGEFYWGIGPTTPESNKEFYTFNMLKANLKTAWRFNNSIYAGIQYNYEKMYNIGFSNGGALETSGITGALGYTSAGIGFTVYADTRDNIYFPYSGHYVEFSNVWYSKSLGSNHNFNNLTIDARKYIQLYQENILAMQFWLSANEGNVPFRMMGTLGSDMFMRGYYNGRLRDKNAMAAQAELRKTIWGPISFTLFLGMGSVNHELTKLSNNIRPNFGVGLRVKAIPRERLNMRLDFGFGNKDTKAMYITLNEAF